MEEIDRWWMSVVSLWRTFTGTGANCLRSNAVSSGLTRRVESNTWLSKQDSKAWCRMAYEFAGAHAP